MCHGRASGAGRLTVPREKSRHCERMCPAGPCEADACGEPFVACRPPVSPPSVPPTACATHRLCRQCPLVPPQSTWSPTLASATTAHICLFPPTSASFRPRRSAASTPGPALSHCHLCLAHVGPRSAASTPGHAVCHYHSLPLPQPAIIPASHCNSQSPIPAARNPPLRQLLARVRGGTLESSPLMTAYLRIASNSAYLRPHIRASCLTDEQYS